MDNLVPAVRCSLYYHWILSFTLALMLNYFNETIFWDPYPIADRRVIFRKLRWGNISSTPSSHLNFRWVKDERFIDFPTCSDRTSGDFQFWFHLSVTHGISKTWKIMGGSSLMVGFTGYSSGDFQICHVHPLKIGGKKTAWKKHQYHTRGSTWKKIYIFLAARWWFYDWLLNALASLQRVFPPSEVRPTNQHEALQGKGGHNWRLPRFGKDGKYPPVN